MNIPTAISAVWARCRADEAPVVEIRADKPERVAQEYIVQISRADAIKLSTFSTSPNGSLRLGDRLTVEAVEGGGLLVRTKPVGYYER